MIHPLPNYPGSKGGSGVAKRLVSLMPPHRVYIEAFLGGGAVLRLKRPAALSIGIDLDPAVVRAWSPAATPGLTLAAAIGVGDDARATSQATMRTSTSGATMQASHVRGDDVPPSLCIAEGDFFDMLALSPPVLQDLGTLVYLDPPYMGEVRTNRVRYTMDMPDNARHSLLLAQGWTHIAATSKSMTATEAAALAIADNRTSDLSEFDATALDALLATIETDDPALQAMLDDLAAENLANVPVPPGDGGDDFDAAAAAEGPCRVKAGELWLIDTFVTCPHCQAENKLPPDRGTP